jgi:hypothetical protein
LDWLGNTLGFKKPEDWYQLSATELVQHGGTTLYSRNQFSRFNLLKQAFPNVDWKPWCFGRVERGFWQSRENQRKYMDWLGNELAYSKMEDWYQIKTDDVYSRNGISLVKQYYKGSVTELVTSVYHDYTWLPWLFKHLAVPDNYWDDQNNLVQYVKWLEGKVGITDKDQWLHVGVRAFVQHRGHWILMKYRGLLPLLRKIYPDYDWPVSQERAQRATGLLFGKAQAELLRELHQLLPPGTTVRTNYRHPGLSKRARKTSTDNGDAQGGQLQLDVFVPSFSFAIEYQGQYHFEANVGQKTEPTEVVKVRDELKQQACQTLGITLIPVVYGEIKQLANIIRAVRPDVLSNVQIQAVAT